RTLNSPLSLHDALPIFLSDREGHETGPSQLTSPRGVAHSLPLLFFVERLRSADEAARPLRDDTHRVWRSRVPGPRERGRVNACLDRKSTRLNSSHLVIS